MPHIEKNANLPSPMKGNAFKPPARGMEKSEREDVLSRKAKRRASRLQAPEKEAFPVSE